VTTRQSGSCRRESRSPAWPNTRSTRCSAPSTLNVTALKIRQRYLELKVPAGRPLAKATRP
jgi:hypothetical protein